MIGQGEGGERGLTILGLVSGSGGEKSGNWEKWAQSGKNRQMVQLPQQDYNIPLALPNEYSPRMNT